MGLGLGLGLLVLQLFLVTSSSGDPNLQKSFNINEEDLDQQAVLFEQVCAQKFQTLDDDDGDIWSKRIASSKGDENQKK